ncbi:MAG: MlaE family ABC transporter permease [Kiritimatiellia bacterium]
MTLTREPLYEDAPSGPLEALRRHAVGLFSAVGRCGHLAVESLACLPVVLARRDSRAAFTRQLYTAGIRTLPVITVVGLFTGMILGLQVGLALRRFNQESLYLGATVMLTLIREMGPFVTGICLSACVGSAMAAELGTMTVNDEVAALEIMSISPVRYLASPRMGALLVMAPILAFYACVLGVIGGGIVGQTQLNVEFQQYMKSAMAIATVKDLFVGLLKSAVFGVVIGAVSCHQGFATRLGAVGVGRATQHSVIISFLLILMLGYMVTRAFYIEFIV